MEGLAGVDGARLVSLASGRGEAPSAGEWPVVALLALVFALVVGRLLMSFGLTRVEAGLVALAAPFSVMLDVPLGSIGPGVALAANIGGCLLPLAVGVKVLAQGRAPPGQLLFLMGVATLVSFASSEVVPSRGVLLHYRLPAFVTGLVAALLWRHTPAVAGAAAYAAGAAGVVIGADLVRITELAGAGGASRIVIGGAGLLDGIYLVAFLSAGVGASLGVLVRWVLSLRPGSRPAAG